MKFIILSCRRSGTAMMRRALMTHPQVCCRAEVVAGQPDYRELSRDWRIPTDTLLAERARDLIPFLERYVFSSPDPDRLALGCKLFYEHADPVDPTQPWRWLGDQADLRVINLQRRNHLRRLLSRRTAQATGEWMRRRSTTVPSIPKIEIKLDDFLADMRAVESSRSLALARLNRQGVMPLYYEDLVADFSGSMAQVQDFLGVRPLALASDTLKQNTQPLAERISNFEALRVGLAGTPHAWMLDD